jgi:protein-tyrosine-phosphatase
MESQLIAPPEVLKLAGHAVRWNLLTWLARSDYRVQELVERLKLPQNLVSYHLRQLRDGHLLIEHRSTADERAIYYGLDITQFRHFFLSAGETLHPAIASDQALTAHHDKTPDHPPLRVLFLCTENSARSQMAEALMRHLSHGQIEAESAGSHPAEQMHPLARRVMEQHGIDMSQAVPKHFEQFRGQHFDTVITVCDRVREVCPTFPDDPEHIHWSFSDPALIEGPEEVRYHAFEQTSLQLAIRIRLLITLLEREKGYRA